MAHTLLSPVVRYFPAVASGFLLTLGFPGAGLFWLSFFALVPLWICLGTLPPAKGFKAGLVAGLTHFISLIYWLVPTLTNYGGLNVFLALATLVLLCLYLALYPALFAWIMARTRGPAGLEPLWGATVWVGLEFVRTHALSGFPWGVLGYSQYTNPLLVQMADLFGVLGISFVIVVCNGVVASAWPLIRNRKRFNKTWVALVCNLILPVLALGYGIYRLPQVKKEIAAAPPVKIAVIQGNIEQSQKWSPAFKTETVKRYGTLSRSSAPADLIIWPETALPFYYGRDSVFSSQVDDIVRQARSPFLIGSPAAELDGETVRYYNRAYMLNPMGFETGYYDKSHLVPFGEYVPFQDLLFFVKKITQEAGNFTPGTTGKKPLAFGGHSTGVLICFEILFPNIAREFVLNGADILTTITNDAWFGKTAAPTQHFAIAVLRAVETRRSLVRAANTGISGFILPTGEIKAATGLFEAAGLVRTVPALTRTSFFTRHGDLLGMAAILAIFLFFVVKGFKKFL